MTGTAPAEALAIALARASRPIEPADFDRLGSSVAYCWPRHEADLACLRADGPSVADLAGVQVDLLLRVGGSRQRSVPDDPLAGLARHRSLEARLMRESNASPRSRIGNTAGRKGAPAAVRSRPQRPAPTPGPDDSRKENAPCQAFAPSAI